jgi:hypothetical protein
LSQFLTISSCLEYFQKDNFRRTWGSLFDLESAYIVAPFQHRLP